MPCARGAEDDTSVIPTQVLQLHRHPVRWKDLHGLVRPLYGADPFDIDELIDAEVTDLRYRVQSIQIEVMEGETALITSRQDEGGAMDVFIDTQARRQVLPAPRLPIIKNSSPPWQASPNALAKP